MLAYLESVLLKVALTKEGAAQHCPVSNRQRNLTITLQHGNSLYKVAVELHSLNISPVLIDTYLITISHMSSREQPGKQHFKDTLYFSTVTYNALKQAQRLQSYNPAIISNTRETYRTFYTQPE